MSVSRLHVAVAVVVVSAGCIGYTDPDNPPLEINLHGSVNTTEEGFRVDGSVVTEGRITNQTYHGVVVCLYDADRRLLNQSESASLTDPTGEVNVSLSAEQRPEFIVVNSTDFWETPNIRVVYLQASDDIYVASLVDDPSDLPVEGCTA